MDILKTWPGFMPRSHTLEVFHHGWARFYFSLGRGKPSQAIDKLWFTHRGQVIGHFHISEIKRNDGSLPKLQALDGKESEWQIKPDAWVAICDPPFSNLVARVFHDGFRGWRYFDFDKYAQTMDAKVRL